MKRAIVKNQMNPAKSKEPTITRDSQTKAIPFRYDLRTMNLREQQEVHRITYLTDIERAGLDGVLASEVSIPEARIGMTRVVGTDADIVKASLSEFNIIEENSVPSVTDKADCGIRALQVIGIPTDAQIASNLCGKSEWLTQHDLLELARYEGKNCLVVCGDDCYVGRFDPTNDLFGTVILNTKGNEPHWNVGKLTQMKLVNSVYVVPELHDIKMVNRVAKELGLVVGPRPVSFIGLSNIIGCVRHVVNETISTIGSEKPALRFDLTTKTLTNNSSNKHQIQNGLVSIKIAPVFHQLAMLLCQETTQAVVNNIELNIGFNLPSLNDMEGLTVQDVIKGALAAEIKLYHKQRLDLLQGQGNVRLIFKRHLIKPVRGSWPELVMDPGQLKNLDQVLIVDNRVRYLVPIIRIGTTLRVGYHVGNSKKLSVCVPQVSVGSKLLRMFALLTACDIDIKDLLSNGIAYKGYPGTGKSTILSSLVQEQSDWAAMVVTRGAKDRLIELGLHKDRTASLERWSNLKVTAKHLFIDEATQINWLDLLICLTPSVKSITMFGDPAQIGKVDFMRNIPGKRVLESIMDICSNVTSMTKVYRFKGPLFQALQHLMPGAESAIEAPEATIKLESSVELSDQELNRIVKECDPDIIFVFTNAAERVLRSRLLALSLANYAQKIARVHSKQGLECNRSLVLQWHPAGAAMEGVTNDPQYNFSAATRCKQHLTWWSVGSYDSNVPLFKRINDNVTGGKLPEPPMSQEERARRIFEAIANASQWKYSLDQYKLDIPEPDGLLPQSQQTTDDNRYTLNTIMPLLENKLSNEIWWRFVDYERTEIMTIGSGQAIIMTFKRAMRVVAQLQLDESGHLSLLFAEPMYKSRIEASLGKLEMWTFDMMNDQAAFEPVRQGDQPRELPDLEPKPIRPKPQPKPKSAATKEGGVGLH